MRVTRRGDGPDPGEAAARFGLATAARDVAISVGIVLGLLYLVPIIGRAVGGPRWPGDPQRAALMSAGLKLPARPGLGGFMAAGASPGLLIGLAASALVVGGLLLCRCDA
jgi:ABC-2 type transport system permease protein